MFFFDTMLQYHDACNKIHAVVYTRTKTYTHMHLIDVICIHISNFCTNLRVLFVCVYVQFIRVYIYR